MMTDRQIKLIIGSLLHDIGKVVYRAGDGRNHSQSGCDFLKTEAGISDLEVLNCVRYHHGAHLKNAGIPENACAYVTYYADNVAAFSDRRAADDAWDGFDKTMPLDSVFNILNGHHGKSHYAMQVLDAGAPINYPTEQPVAMDEHFYKNVVKHVTDNLKAITFDDEYLNSLLSVLEANLSYIPSSTSRRELADISLYDHLKMTAAIASCVEQYMTVQERTDYRKYLFENAGKSYDEPMFLLFSMDISGIQSFIYTVAESGALKGLRARSFYLEVMMEHMIDELLDKVSLSRANLIYSGGGHCYMLLPNTEDTIQAIRAYEKELNQWFIENFDIALYVACGYCPASANALQNVPKGSYSDLYMTVSKMISKKKSHRYDAAEIMRLNKKKHDGERECKACRRPGHLTEDKCPVCTALEKMSGSILYDKYFTVVCVPEDAALPLPGNRYLVADSEESLRKRMTETSYVRCYTKNAMFTGKHVTTKLWVGDYTTGDTFEKFAEQAEGVERIGILRADVDNLGQTFVYGFQGDDGDERYVTLSRTAALSRQLSLFFKFYINKILADGQTGIFGKEKKRKVSIVYSGGDDIFLAGSWNDVIAAFIDIKNGLERFAQGTLTISGGIGIYHPKYPLNIMAKEAEHLEERSKHTPGKNAVTVFSHNHNYPWHEFLTNVIGEKLMALADYFDETTEHGMAFLYHLMDFLRNIDENGEKINIARYVYLLSRMEPDKDCDKKEREAYRKFSQKMYAWSQCTKDRRELNTAIYLYVYLRRSKEEDEQ